MTDRNSIVEAVAAYDGAASQDDGLIDVIAKIATEAEARALMDAARDIRGTDMSTIRVWLRNRAHRIVGNEQTRIFRPTSKSLWPPA